MLTHIVMFKLIDRSAESLVAVRDRLLTMRGEIPELLEIEVGADILRTERSWDVVLITRFADVAAMERYQVHPFHKGILAFMKDRRESSIAIDYTGSEP